VAGLAEALQDTDDMLAYFDLPIGWLDLFKRTAKETSADDGFGLAAQLAYYFFLALFPALIFLLALASVTASGDLINRVIGMVSGVLPPDVINIVRDQLTAIVKHNSGGLLTFGAVTALWSSSAALVSLISALNRAYDVEDARPWWKQRGIAILLTIGVAIFVLISIALVVAGPELADALARRVGLGPAFELTWKILQWPVVFILIASALALVYYFAPDVEQDFVWITPGSFIATLLWMAGSLGFRIYVVNFGSYNETYGAIGAVMVLLLWLYMSGLAMVVGAEMNAEIEHASPHGKAPGEKVPGRKRLWGARAARAFREHPPQPASTSRAPAPSVAARQAERSNVMSDQTSSIVELIKTAVRDIEGLVRSEIALAKAELRDEGRRLGRGVGMLAGAAVAAILGVIFGLSALAWGVAVAFNWPVWIGFAIVMVLMLVIAGVLALAGRRAFAAHRHFPRTVATMEENTQWIRSRTS
jgi:membrane protein